MLGSFSARDEWNSGYWGKVDAIAIIVARFYVLMFIISLIISIVALFTVNKMVTTIEKEKFRR